MNETEREKKLFLLDKITVHGISVLQPHYWQKFYLLPYKTLFLCAAQLNLWIMYRIQKFWSCMLRFEAGIVSLVFSVQKYL